MQDKIRKVSKFESSLLKKLYSLFIDSSNLSEKHN